MNSQLILNKAAQYLEQKQYKKAITEADKVLKMDPNSAHGLYIFALANAHTKNKKTALKTFERLVELVPNNSEIHYNHGMILDSFNMPDDATKAFTLAINLNPNHLYAHINLGNLFSQNRQYDAAIKSYQTALNINPNLTGLHTNLCKAYYAHNDFNSCLLHIERMTQCVPIDEQIHSIKIQCYMQLGNYRTANQDAIAMINDFPHHIQGHFLAGLSALKLSRYPVAIKAFSEALKINPSHIDSLMNLAICNYYVANHSEADRIIAELKSAHPDDLAINLFEFRLMEMNNKLDHNDQSLHALLEKHPDNDELNLLNCKSYITAKKYDQAINQLQHLVKSSNQGIKIEATFKLADCYDKTQKYELAWNTYQTANHSLPKTSKDVFNEKLKALITQLKQPTPLITRTNHHETTDPVIFIVGVPRSGTTLIDNILSSQDKAMVLDETPLMADLAERVIHKYSFESHISAINDLTDIEIEALRKQYFSGVRNYQNWDGKKAIIDKSPLNLIHVFLIHTIFPDAPIVFSARHPLDVCISCFMQNFRINPELMHAFSSARAIAETYDHLMTLWNLTNSKVQLNQLTLKYEDVVNQTEQSIKTLINFVGLKWNPAYLNLTTRIDNRGMIHNPSYNQVNQNIYHNKAFRHKNYSEHIQVFNQHVSPWIGQMGY